MERSRIIHKIYRTPLTNSSRRCIMTTHLQEGIRLHWVLPAVWELQTTGEKVEGPSYGNDKAGAAG